MNIDDEAMESHTALKISTLHPPDALSVECPRTTVQVSSSSSATAPARRVIAADLVAVDGSESCLVLSVILDLATKAPCATGGRRWSM